MPKTPDENNGTPVYCPNADHIRKVCEVMRNKWSEVTRAKRCQYDDGAEVTVLEANAVDLFGPEARAFK